MVYTDLLTFNIVSKMMKCDIEVLGSRSILVDFGHLKRATVVFEHATVDLSLCRSYRKPSFLQLLQLKKNSRSILRAAAVLMTRRTQPTRYDTTL